MSIADNPVFQDAEAAREFLESLLWPDGPVCPHCGLIGAARQLQGKAHRPGVYKCKGCEKQFTVTVNTVFERSHIPLNKWLLILHLMVASKKGISAHQIHRMLGLTYKSAWFACHRLREAMRDGKFPALLGGANKVVEADETFVGGKAANRKNYVPPKAVMLSLVERDGSVRSFHIPDVTAETLGPVITANVDKATYLMTDGSPVYPSIGGEYAGHSSVDHSAEEYVRLGGFVHTNTVESHFALIKRGVYGTFHNISEAHLHRYLAEFDFRANTRDMTDGERAAALLAGAQGKRLLYRQPH